MKPYPDNQYRTPLSRGQRAEIKNANRLKKLWKRLKHGTLSIRRSVIKSILTTWLIAGAIALFINRQQIISNLLAEDTDLIFPLSLIGADTITEWLIDISTYAIPVLTILILVLMFGIFGISCRGNKAEEAFITQGIYKDTKAPWVLEVYRKSVYRVYVVYLNGSDEDDFKKHRKGLESEIGKIEDFEPIGTKILLLYVLAGKAKHNPKRDDKEF
ncbi:MAG: hypothetical protein FWE05_13400 [Defluviitaleaceae bacterium]|nr:hypothetical protein [Defluviitaleaceae bacterium]